MGPAGRCRRHAVSLVLAVAVGVATLAAPTVVRAPDAAATASAASRPTPGGDRGRVLFVVDASGSMLEDDRNGEPKITGAKRALTTVLDGLPTGAPVGLRVFGQTGATAATRASCRDSRLVVPVAPLSRPRMTRAVKAIAARGWTPIGYALERARADLSQGSGRASIVLVSDGVDECYPAFGPEPCAVAKALTRSTIELTVQTIGLAVDERARKQLTCIASVTGGRYRDAADAGALSGALRASLQPPLPAPPPAPPEPAPVDVLGVVAGVLALALVVAGVGAAVRRGVRRRRTAYW